MEYHLFISFFALLSRAAGFGFLKAQRWSLPPRYFNTYCYISDCLMGFYVFRILSRPFLPMTLPQALEWISTLLYVGQVFVKSLMIQNKHKQIIICVEKMDQFFQMVNQQNKQEFQTIWKKQYNVANKFCKIIFFSQFLSLILAYAPSFYNCVAGDPTATFITFPSYYFFYGTHYAVKVIYLVIDFITSNFCTLKTSAIEMLYLTFVSYYIASLKYLKQQLKTIINDFLVSDNLDEKMFKWWIETHKETLRQVMLFKQLIRNLLLVIYIYNLLNVVTMIIFVTANGDMETNQKMVAMVVVTVTLFYFFWDCILTDELEYTHASLMFEAYCAEAAFGKKLLKNSIMMSTLRCRKPLRITAGGVFAPSCWNFKELLTTTGSFLIALWEVKNRAMRQNEAPR